MRSFILQRIIRILTIRKCFWVEVTFIHVSTWMPWQLHDSFDLLGCVGKKISRKKCQLSYNEWIKKFWVPLWRCYSKWGRMVRSSRAFTRPATILFVGKIDYDILLPKIFIQPYDIRGKQMWKWSDEPVIYMAIKI